MDKISLKMLLQKLYYFKILFNLNFSLTSNDKLNKSYVLLSLCRL